MQFRLFNIPVIVQPTFWIFLLIFCFEPSLQPIHMILLALILSISLLFHELGHAFAVQYFGKAPVITLEGFGGYASYDGRGLAERQHFIVTLCGPLCTAFLIVLSHFFLNGEYIQAQSARFFFYYLKKLNIFWLIVNIAPLLPLDGGKLAEYFFRKWFGDNKGTIFCLGLGNMTAVIGGAYFLSSGNYFFACVFLYHGWQNFQVFQHCTRNSKPTPLDQYNEAIAHLENKEDEKAAFLLQKLIRSKNDFVKIHSIETLAEILDKKGESAKAYGLLQDSDYTKLNKGKWLLCKLAYMSKNYELSAKFAHEIYSIHPKFEIAFLNARTFARLRIDDQALGWLKTALQFEEAQQNMHTIMVDDAFVALQENLEFAALKSEVLHGN